MVHFVTIAVDGVVPQEPAYRLHHTESYYIYIPKIVSTLSLSVAQSSVLGPKYG